MKDESKYFVLKQKAVPEVLLKVVEAKRLLESGKAATVQDAAEAVGISRSSFYKYKEDIFSFLASSQGRTVTFTVQMDDEPGLLSLVLGIVADFHANILTIHQSIPVNEIATITISMEITGEKVDITKMLEDIETMRGVQYMKILARE